MPSLISKLLNSMICSSKKPAKTASSYTTTPVVVHRKAKTIPSLNTIEENKLYRTRVEERKKEEDRIEDLATEVGSREELHGCGINTLPGQFLRKTNPSGQSTPPMQLSVVC